MSGNRFRAAVAMRRWSLWCGSATVAWGALGWLIAPAIIRSAYSGGLFGFLGGLLSGRDTLSADHYVSAWTNVATPVLLALVAGWLAGALVVQPVTWRLLRSAYARLPILGGRVERRTVAVGLALAAVSVGMHTRAGSNNWDEAIGHEYEQIARSISDGEGFSFPPDGRWLYLDEEPASQEYGATAWKEPIYPYFLAGWFEALGPRGGRVAVVASQILFLVATCLLVYCLGCRLFGPVVGSLAALVTILQPDLHWIMSLSLQVPAVSGMLLVAGLLLLFRYGDAPGPKRAAGLGLFLGLATLTHAVLIVLVPIAMLFVWLRTGLRPALFVGLVAALAISPWTARNYARFGHLIPVQTGFGLFANVTTPYLVETYDPGLDACGDGTPPVFQSDGPFEALMTLRGGGNYTQIWRRGVRCVAERNAGVYTTLNEHERDGLHKRQLTSFVRESPGRFLELSAAKTVAYLFDVPVHGRGSIPLAALGLGGMLLVLRRPHLWVFTAAVLAYSAPFILTAPIYYRYRAPLTPLLTLLAMVALCALLARPARWLKARWGSGPE